MAEVNNLLHTYARKYLDGFDINFPMQNHLELQKKIGYLRSLEKNFYNKFSNGKANNYKDFMYIVRRTLNNINPQDGEVLKRFANQNLRARLKELESKYVNVHTEELMIVLDFTNFQSIDLSKKLKGLGKELDIKINPNQKYITIDKTILNAKTGRAIARIMNPKLRKQAHSLDNVTPILSEMIDEGILNLSLEGNPIDKEKFELSWKTNVKNFPWGYTAKDMKDIQKTEQPIKLQQGIDSAIKIVRDFIFKNLGEGKSETMAKAMTNTWNSVMSNLGFSFFSKGFTNGVIGALGEFQTALLSNYLKLTSGIQEVDTNITADELTKNLLTGKNTSEKQKTDVQIMLDNKPQWGVQVKNINEYINGENAYANMIGTNVHPLVFANSVEAINPKFGTIKDDFLTFIANYAFNETFATGRDDYYEKNKKLTGNGAGQGEIIFEKFQRFAVQEVASLMNLSVHKNIKDTVCFYVVGGTNLIPASMLVQAVWDTWNTRQSIIKPPTIVANSIMRQTDSEFHRNADSDIISARKIKKKNKQKKEVETNANLVKYSFYWNGHFGQEDWEPTEANKNLFNDLITSKVRIDSGFRYKQLLEQTRIFAENYIHRK